MAVQHLMLAIKEQPRSADLHNDLGVAYMEQNEERSLENAVREFQTALVLNPRHAASRFNLALAYERLGEFPEAEQHLKLYLQADSASGWAADG